MGSSDSSGAQQILKAATRGDAAEVARLLEAEPLLIEVRYDEGGNTPLHMAAGEGHAEVVKVLLANGADVNTRGKGGDTPLHWAALSKRAGAAQVLLAEGADLNVRNIIGQTPLHNAALGLGGEDVEIVELLLEGGADVNARDAGYTPLDLAARGGHSEVADLLRRHGGKTGSELGQ